MSLDDISVIVGRLLIAVVVVGALYVAVHTIAPGWLSNEINNALNSVQSVALGDVTHHVVVAAGRLRVLRPAARPVPVSLPRAA